MKVIDRSAVLLIIFIFCMGASAQTDPPTKVVVIPLGGNEAAKEKIIFVSKDRYNGNLGGREGADGICQADADAPDSKVKGKKFRAWLGGPKTDPAAGERQFAVYELPYVTPNGDVYFESYTDQRLINPWPFLSIAANGEDVSSALVFDDVWTGRYYTGVASGIDCANWSSQSGSENGTVFWEESQSSSSFGTTLFVSACSTVHIPRLICMEQ